MKATLEIVKVDLSAVTEVSGGCDPDCLGETEIV